MKYAYCIADPKRSGNNVRVKIDLPKVGGTVVCGEYPRGRRSASQKRFIKEELCLTPGRSYEVLGVTIRIGYCQHPGQVDLTVLNDRGDHMTVGIYHFKVKGLP
jgi:hypothetical protein